MCGKQNPDHLDECQHCGARLKPLLASNQGSNAPFSQSSQEDQGADWLNSLRSEDDAPDSSDDFNVGDDELPDWLQMSSDAEAPQPEPVAKAEGADLDWLSDMRQEDSATSEESLGVDDDQNEWLDRLPGMDEAPAAQEPVVTTDDLPDWMSGLGRESQTPAAQGEEAEGDDELPDWLAEARKEPEPADDPDVIADELPDWLSGLSGEPVEPAEAATPVESAGLEAAPAEDLPDWLAEMKASPIEDAEPAAPAGDAALPAWLSEEGQAEEKEPAAPAEDIPDWMAAIGGETASSEPSPAAEADLPDWLSSEGESVQPEPAAFDADIPDWMKEEREETAPEPAAPVEEMPDWLTDLGDAPPVPTEPAPAQQDEEELPDWLLGESGIREPEQAAPAAEVPDWMTEFEGEPSASPEPAAKEAAEETEDVPDWLAEADDATLIDKALESEPSDISEWLEEEPLDVSPPEAADDVPDWFSEIESSVPAVAEEAPDAFSAFPEEAESALEGGDEEDAPDWLSDIQGEPIEPGPAAEELDSGVAIWAMDDDSPSFASVDDATIDELFDDSSLPDWLSDVSDDDDDDLGLRDESVEEDAEGDSSAERTEVMPEWLQAMRPSGEGEGAALKEQREGELERVGPLAGLRALLPAEPAVVRAGKPATYSVKLQITEAQQKHIDVFQKMIEDESHPQPITTETMVSSQHILRWIVAAVLFVVLLLPLIIPMEPIPLPDNIPSVNTTHQLISALPAGAPVLVAFDYEPGLSGELDAAAAIVADHLMLKDARFAFVSTSPLGAALGEHFLQKTQKTVDDIKGILYDYKPGEQYVNLGYISGGTAGLLNFAIAPQKTVSLPFDDANLGQIILEPEANNAWNTPALEGVNTLSDFALTIVITDDPDTARSWIEQVQPALRRNSLVMIVSAQAEPLMLPYYESSEQQVSGMVTGLVGAAAYEARQGRSLLAGQYWNSFGFGILVAQALIFFGGAYNLIMAWQKRSKETTEKK